MLISLVIFSGTSPASISSQLEYLPTPGPTSSIATGTVSGNVDEFDIQLPTAAGEEVSSTRYEQYSYAPSLLQTTMHKGYGALVQIPTKNLVIESTRLTRLIHRWQSHDNRTLATANAHLTHLHRSEKLADVSHFLEPAGEDEESSTDELVTTAISGDLGAPPASPANTIALEEVKDYVQLRGFTHQWQTWNNCGPATITIHMSYFGRSETQAEAAQFLKPNSDDKNVSPHELAAYVRSIGLEAVVRQGGSREQLKFFLSNDFPILTEIWLDHDGDGLGHYRLLTGYDDEIRQFYTYDSLKGENYKVAFDQFDADWRVFNRLYVVIYPPERAELVSSLLQNDMDDAPMYERIAAEAQLVIEANPNDAIAYFNQGEALTQIGRYQEAVVAFDQARNLGLHWRRLWYQFTPFEAYLAVGRYQDVLDLADATIASTGGQEEAYYYQGLALHAMGLDGAESAFQAAIKHNPNFAPAQEAAQSLSTSQSSSQDAGG